MKISNWLFLPLSLILLGCPPPVNVPPVPASRARAIAQIQSGVAVAVVLDTSGSMGGQKIEDVKRILLTSIKDKLNLYNVMGEGKLHLALIDCGSGFGSEIPLPMDEFNESLYTQTINSLSADGGTPLARCVHHAYQELLKSGASDKHIFVLSDGQAEDNLSQELASRLPSVGIHVIGFQSDESYYAPFKDVGGQVIMVDDAETLDTTTSKIFKAILKLEDD